METRIDQAAKFHERGFNCAQAVACTYCDLVGVSEVEAFRAMEAFGLGMGGMQGTCGALSGAVYLAGLINSCANLDEPTSKGATYKISREILERFNAMNGSTLCYELKGVGTDHGVLRPCPGCIEDACKIVEEVLFAQ